jgi:DNA-binding Xre family transcriptional regulator
MTAKHLLDGVMQHTKARNYRHASILLGLDPATIFRLSKGKTSGMRIETLDHIQRKTEIPVETLFAWYRLPDGAQLGRIAIEV